MITVRGVSKGEAASNEVLASSKGLPTCVVKTWLLDHESYKSILDLGRINESDCLDYVLINTEVNMTKYEEKSRSGDEPADQSHRRFGDLSCGSSQATTSATISTRRL